MAIGRPLGGKNRKWTTREKLMYVQMCVEENMPVRTVARNENIPYGTLKGWVEKYRLGGMDAVTAPKRTLGNRFAALHTSKSISDEDRLRLMVEKLQIENERLKKGYIVKGVGAAKEFVTLKDLNSK